MFDDVVFISLDTLRSDGIGANPRKLWPGTYGIDRTLRTPVLDEIASGGAFFTTCITAAPYTSASHATFMTGRWPLTHGVFEFFNRKLAVPTVFAAARRAGFATTFKVDFPIILGNFLGFSTGIDRYIVEDDDAFIDALEPGRRNFAFAHFGGLHVPYGFHNLKWGGAAYVETVTRLEEELPAGAARPVDSLVETYREADDLALMVRYKRVVQYHYERGNYAKLFGLYLAGIEHFVEHRFAPFFRKLQRRLAGRRYLIVLFGDHGEEYDAESYGHHNSVSEGVVRVPLVFYGTGVRAARHTGRVRSVDVVPTVLDLLGDRRMTSAGSDGASLAETVTAGSAYEEAGAYVQSYVAETTKYVEYQRRLLSRGRKTGGLPHVLFKEAVYGGPYKLTRTHYEQREGGGIWGLHKCEPRVALERIAADGALRRVVDSERAAVLAGELDRYNASRPRRPRRLSPSPELRRQLQHMGYRV